MASLSRVTFAAFVRGSIASLISTVALAGLAKLDGKGFAQPTNSTSHWLYGRTAAHRKKVDISHTLVGFLTHHASAVFWALPFEVWLARRPGRSFFELLRDAGILSVVAALVDYRLAPKRLTPGWEMVLSKRSMIGAYSALAIGFALAVYFTSQRSKG
jgi:hypothetical protein